MKKSLVLLLTFGLLVSLVISPVAASVPTDRTPPIDVTPSRPEPELLPQEVLDMFKDGIPVEEFLAMNNGPIPNALMEYANLPITVIVQLKEPGLIEQMQKPGIQVNQLSYSAQLQSAQDSVISQISSVGVDAVVMGRYTKVLNGFMAQVAYKDLAAIRNLPGVKSVKRAPEHVIDLGASVPLIGADMVHMGGFGFTGKTITVAVIDTGIDYTHAMFGGAGDSEEYAGNDPDFIEAGTFPTAKVIGGYDFAGTDYDAGGNSGSTIPTPDDDPLDEAGHGTHVASTIAGVDVGFGSGVAPDAELYALKVFGAAGSTNLVVDAIEWAMDPNGDGDMEDHVDVINMSLGSSFGPADPDDPEYLAVEAANAIGVFVVASAGNAGDVNYVTGSPGNTDSALSVASSTTGYMTSPYLTYAGGDIPYTTSYNPFVTNISAELVDVMDYGDIDGQLCTTDDVQPLTDKIALIVRGTCSFFVKVNNAEELGAVGVLIYNNTTGVINMDTSGSELPAGSLLQSDGLLLKEAAPLVIDIGPDSRVKTFVDSTPADAISTFSSRGPRGYDSMLKPEITAPGTSIFAANMGSGSEGVSMSGTSMAAPHVAGVVALMKQAHPTWTNEQIKAALMNTAVDIGKDVPVQGAGRVDALAAMMTYVVAVGDENFVSMNWGLLELNEDTFTSTKEVVLQNLGGFTMCFSVSAEFTSSSDGATLVPEKDFVCVAPNKSVEVGFELTLDVANLPIDFGDMEEYFGYVTFAAGPYYELSVPFYFVPRPYTVISELDAETSFDDSGLGYIDFEQNGPVASDLYTLPVTMVSDNDPDVIDMADLRYVGMDFGGNSPYGKIITTAFNMWAPQHALQPYWSEVDMYIYGDAPEPVANFNHNLASLSGASYPDNTWIVAQIDYNDGNVYLASPYAIYSDFNSGLQEWYLPAPNSYVTDKFEYEVVSFDWYGISDYAGVAKFDVTRPPLYSVPVDFDTWSSYLPDPQNEEFSVLVEVDDVLGYLYSEPLGIMLVDYHGKPGIGQAYFVPVTITSFPSLNIYLPLLLK